MLKRPPAKLLYRAPVEGILGRVSGSTGGAAALQAGDRYGGSRAGVLDPTPAVQSFLYHWQDILQVNPAKVQPKLIQYSAAQPIIRTGHLRRFVRTFMTAGPRFQGRWAYVGFVERHYSERARMTGVATRQGTTYAYPKMRIAPRSVQLGPPQ